MGPTERMKAARERVGRLEREFASARRELDELERAAHASARPAIASSNTDASAMRPAPVSAVSSPAEKVALFRSRFAGRQDAYALPWESRRTGKKGWSPAVRGGFYSDAVREADLLPLTDAVIEHHLRGGAGGIHVGLYPLTRDDRCALLVCDCDDGSWREDAAAYAAACRHAGIDIVAEIS